MLKITKVRKGRDSPKSLKICKRVVSVRWVYSLNAGGRKQRTSVFAIAGTSKGRVGIGLGKAKNTTVAAKKAVDQASKLMKRVYAISSMPESSVHHSVVAKHGATRVVVMPSVAGQGIKAGDPVRLLMECLGVKNVVVKVHGSNNPINTVKAVLKGLNLISSPREISARRNVSYERVIGRQVPDTVAPSEQDTHKISTK